MTELKNKLNALGVHQGEFAHLVGVSRVTAGSWCNGKSVPSKFTSPLVESVLRVLERAHKEGRLAPLADIESAAERREFLEALTDSRAEASC